MTTISIALIIVAVVIFMIGISNHHAHSWVWSGEGNFHKDFGESRAQASNVRSYHPDSTTVKHLMYGKGWRLKCKSCGEIQWE